MRSPFPRVCLAPRLAMAFVFIAISLSGPSAAFGQQSPAPPVADGTLIKRVEFKGLNAISEAFVRRVVKSREQQSYSRRQVEDDVRELLKSRKFLIAFAESRTEENQAVIVFVVQEKPRLATVELEGSKNIPDSELLALLPAAGDVVDMFAINKGRDDIAQKYKEKGYYYVKVTLDDRALREESRAVYRINEGPRVRVRNIYFDGNRSYPGWRLSDKVETKTWIWIIRTGEFDEDRANRDALDLQKFYRDEGFLDARVGYRLDFDPIERSDLNLVFVIEEGIRYQLKNTVVEGATVFAAERIMQPMRLTPGKYIRNEAVEEDKKRVRDLYGEIGYVDVRVETVIDYTETPGEAVLRYQIAEGEQFHIARITIRGNDKTKDEVIRRELRFYPGELYDTVKVRKAETRINELAFFVRDKTRISPLEDADHDGAREALVEVEEGDTTYVLFGVGVSTDNGVFGSITVDNRNFDIFDFPRSWSQFLRGQSLRGDGQRLRLLFEPGTEVSRFRIDFTEPYLFDRLLRYDQSFYLFQRGRDAYVEQRLGTTSALSRRFDSGPLENWGVEGALRLEGVDINDVDDLAAKEIVAVEGDSFLTSLKGTIVRDTTDSRIVPTEGYRVAFSWEQYGALGGEYAFGKPALSGALYRTVRTDIFDRKSVLAFRLDTAYIVGDAPVFEKFYGGGFGSIRGFSYRGVSPRNGIKNDRIGGDFLLLTGGEYSFPLYGKAVRGVTFVDMGTVEENIKISDWRIAVGFGLRIQVDFFGPAPIVLDFGIPVRSAEDDDEQLFNFAFGASF